MKFCTRLLCVVPCVLSAVTAAAQPRVDGANIVLTTAPAPGFPVSSLGLHPGGAFGGTRVEAGIALVIPPANPAFASPIEVSVQSETSGLTRTLTVTFETSGDAFVTPAAVAAVLNPDVVFTGLYFNLETRDEDWDGGSVVRSWGFFKDDIELRQISPSTRSDIFVASVGILNSVFDPTQAGFYAGSEVANKMVFTQTYGVTSADCPADINDDGGASPADFTAWLVCFQNPQNAGFCDRADVNGDGNLDPADFTAWLTAFNLGCL